MKKRKNGPKPLYADVQPAQYFFKSHPGLTDKIEKVIADLDAHGIKANKSSVMRVLIDLNIDDAVRQIKAHIEG
jgi:hypothetical protein